MTPPDTRWYVACSEQCQGPYKTDEIVDFVKEGKFTPNTMVCPVGGDAWIRLSEALPNLFHSTPVALEMTLEEVPPPPPPSTTNARSSPNQRQNTSDGITKYQYSSGMIAFMGIVGVLIGGFVGYVMRPALFGALKIPFNKLFDREGMPPIGKQIADESLLTIACGAILGLVVGLVAGAFLGRKAKN